LIQPRQIALEAARAADQRKATDIRVLDLRGRFVADFFVVATVLNRHQGKAIAEDLLHQAKGMKLFRAKAEGMDDGTWILVDLGDVVVHLLDPEYRKFYDLEQLWGDTRKVAWRELKAARARAKTKAALKALTKGAKKKARRAGPRR